jgi:hypothetical protein
MASRKEQKEALRRERMEREQQAQRSTARKRLVGIVVAAVLVLGIVAALAVVLLAGGDDGGGGNGGGGGATVSYPDGGTIPDQREADLAKAMAAAGCKDETIQAEGAGQHSTDPNERIKYASEPPSIGRHYQVPAEDDIYDEAPRTEMVVHDLEHGRILIWIRPDASPELLGQFKALYDEDPYHVIMLPRKELKQPFAVTAWVGQNTGHTLRCKDVNDRTWDAIRAFKERYRDKAPEFVP